MKTARTLLDRMTIHPDATEVVRISNCQEGDWIWMSDHSWSRVSSIQIGPDITSMARIWYDDPIEGKISEMIHVSSIVLVKKTAL